MADPARAVMPGTTQLAFDTSGPIGSVALAREGDVLARGIMTVQTAHAATLIPTIEDVLDEADVTRGDIGELLVGEGPGSFTGVRVTAATAKGLGHALGIPVRAASSLAAAALAWDVGPVRYALFDARAERVYGGCWGVGSDHLEELVSPHAGELRDVLAGEVPAGAVFVGDAAEKHRAVIEGAGFLVGDPDPARTLADGLVAYFGHVTVDPIADLGGWEPAYVRASSAERLWKT
jgi:tRNA threonylcarbamoyladenosine biosynthesis protein TsaB